MKQLSRQAIQEMLQHRRTLPLRNKRMRSGTLIFPKGAAPRLEENRLKAEFDQQPSQKRKQRREK